MPQSANENDDASACPPKGEPDAHGQAALMLAESILHALIESATLTDREALEVVHTAQEVKADLAALPGESSRRMQQSGALLDRIAMSLATDFH